MQTLGQLPPEKGTQRCGLVGGSCKSSVGTAVESEPRAEKNRCIGWLCTALFSFLKIPALDSLSFIDFAWMGFAFSRTSRLNVQARSTWHSIQIPWTLSCPGTIFRIKGILAVKSHPFKHVFHAVMDVSDEADAEPWGKDEKRITKIVFIGALVTGGKLRPAIGNPWIFPGTLAYGILLVTHVISISCYIWCFCDSRHTHTYIYISIIHFVSCRFLVPDSYPCAEISGKGLDKTFIRESFDECFAPLGPEAQHWSTQDTAQGWWDDDGTAEPGSQINTFSGSY